MNYTWFIILSASILIAALIAILRFKKLDTGCYPFVFCIWIGTVNELISIIQQEQGHTTAVNNNLYVLIEAILLVGQCWRWEAFDRRKSVFIPLFILIPITWATENFIVFTIAQTQPWFRLFYSCSIVLLAINILNKLIIEVRQPLYRHPVFLITTGWIIYFTYKLIIEACWITQAYATPGFMYNIYSIHTWINCITNLIYATALLWMPKKLPFTLPY
jgi:hypothetical protein